MKKLAIQYFIEQHSDWEKILSEKPYSLIISRDQMFSKNLIMFKYNIIESDFNIGLVNECRGLILDEDTNEIVSFPFTKFFNYGEPHAANIDWSSARTGTKIDGSLIKIVRLGSDYLISTNGTIDAFKAPVAEQLGCVYASFGQIVSDVLAQKVAKSGFKLEMLEKNVTYMFELVSPWTKVVIPYHENDLWFLGCRNNLTHQETHFADHWLKNYFKIPEVLPLKTIDDCLNATSKMPWDDEGYVVCDANFNRVKVKSAAYLAVHRLKGNGVMSYARAIELVRTNEIDEVIAYFPEFKDALDECKAKFWELVAKCESAWEEYLKIDGSLPTRKDKALWITKNFVIPGLAFGLLDKKIESVKSFFMSIPTEKLLKFLGYKE